MSGILDTSKLSGSAGAFATNAVANTQNTDTWIAAPGVGLRLRIYSITVGWQITAAIPPPALNSAISFRTLATTVVLGIGYPGAPSDYWGIPMGFAMNDNQALTAIESASAATLHYYFGILFSTEPT